MRTLITNGTIVAADGLIVTKASQLGDKIECHMADGRKLPATVLGRDDATDIALKTHLGRQVYRRGPANKWRSYREKRARSRDRSAGESRSSKTSGLATATDRSGAARARRVFRGSPAGSPASSSRSARPTRIG